MLPNGCAAPADSAAMEKAGCFLDDGCHEAGHESAQDLMQQAGFLLSYGSDRAGACAVLLASSHKILLGVCALAFQQPVWSAVRGFRLTPITLPGGAFETYRSASSSRCNF